MCDCLFCTCLSLQKVVLDRSVGKLGLSIIGGSEHATRIFGGGRPGVYVSKVSVFKPTVYNIHICFRNVHTCVCLLPLCV